MIPTASSPISVELSPISAELLPNREAIDGCAVADAAIPIVERLTKHCKTLLNTLKHHETVVKHCDTS